MKKLNLFTIAVLIATSAFAQSQSVDVKKSSLKWEGKKIGGAHEGLILLKEGRLDLKKGNITGGTFLIDMNSITCTDLEGDYNAKLVGHLKSDDFFGVQKYPTAKLVITKSTSFRNGEAKVTADLSIKKDTHPVEFTVKKSGGAYKASVVVDRAKYDVRYGSKSFFDNLGDKVIYDEFTLDVNIVTE